MAGNSIGVNVVSVVFDKTKLAFMKWLFSAYLRQSKLLKISLFEIKIDISEVLHTSKYRIENRPFQLVNVLFWQKLIT